MKTQLKIAWISARRGKDKMPAVTALTAEYMNRIARYAPTDTAEFESETALFAGIKRPGRTAPFVIVLDARGKQLSSEELADFLRKHVDQGTRRLVFAVGGADGFSDEARKSAHFQLSLGKMTLPHELARVVLLEQLYRAFTILKGHPYHTGH